MFDLLKTSYTALAFLVVTLAQALCIAVAQPLREAKQDEMIMRTRIDVNRPTLGVSFGVSKDIVYFWSSNELFKMSDADPTQMLGVERLRKHASIKKVVPLKSELLVLTSSYSYASVVSPDVQSPLVEWFSKTQDTVLNDVDISPSGTLLAIAWSRPAQSQSCVELVDITTKTTVGTIIRESGRINGVTTVRFNRSQSEIAVGWYDEIIRYQIETRKEVARYPRFAGAIGMIEWEQHGKYLAATCNPERDIFWKEIGQPDLRVHIISGSSASEVAILGRNHMFPVTGFVFRSIDNAVCEGVTGGGVKDIRFWNVETGNVVRSDVKVDHGGVVSLAVSQDGSRVAVISCPETPSPKASLTIYEFPTQTRDALH